MIVDDVFSVWVLMICLVGIFSICCVKLCVINGVILIMIRIIFEVLLRLKMINKIGSNVSGGIIDRIVINLEKVECV